MRTRHLFSSLVSMLFATSLFSQTPGTKKWEYLTGFWITSSPAIDADGIIYVGSWDYKLYAINPDGTKKWEYLTGGYVGSSPVIGNDGTVYVSSWDNKLYAINSDGTKKWEYLTHDRVISSPAIGADGTIYLSHYDNILSALYPDGTLKWEYLTLPGAFSYLAIGADGTVYLVKDKLYAINPNGTKKWDYLLDYTDSFSSPAIGSDGTIYIHSGNNYLYAIKPDGTKKWEYLTGGGVASAPAIGADGIIYFGTYDGKFYAINPDGTKKWEYLTGGGVASSPAIGADGVMYFGTYDGKLYAINPDGTKQWEYLTGREISSSVSICIDGTIYFGSNDSKLYAIYSTSFGLASSPWPKYGHDNLNQGRVTDIAILNTDFTNIALPNQAYNINLSLFSSYNSKIAVNNVSVNDVDFEFLSSMPMTVVPGVLKELTLLLTAPQNKWYKPTISIDYTVDGSDITKEFNLEGLIFLDDSTELAHTANQVMPVWKSLDKSNEILLNNTKGIIYRLLSDYAAADSCFDLAVSKALNARYGYAGIMMNTGVVKSDQAITDSAGVFYDDALKDIQATADTSALAPQIWYNQAWEAYKKADYAGAASLAMQTINHAKANAYLKAKAYTLLGAIRYAQEKQSDAIDAFNQAVTMDKYGPIGKMARENLEMILGSGIDQNPVGPDIKLYPNPSNGKIVISTGNLPGDLNITVFNQTGEKVYSALLTGSANSLRDLDLSHLADGMYTVLIVSDNLVFTDKIVIINK